MKKKFMALTLAAAVMLTGAGYAYWNDQLTINNTVSTGQLDLYFVDQADEVTEPDYTTGAVTYAAGPNGEANGTASLTLDDMYPGATATVNLVVKNDSTMPVELASAAFSGVTGDWSQFNVAIEVDYVDVNGASQSVAFNGENSLKGIHIQEGSNINLEYTIAAKTTMANNTTENQTYTANISPVFQQYNVLP